MSSWRAPTVEPMSGLVSHPSTAADRELHAALFAQTRRDDLLGAGLALDVAEHMAAFQEASFEELLHLYEGPVEDFTWTLNGWPVARLVLHHQVEAPPSADRGTRLVWMVVAETGRRRGIARAIVSSVLASHAHVTTRVGPDKSVAQHLFTSLGFTVTQDAVGDLVFCHTAHD